MKGTFDIGKFLDEKTKAHLEYQAEFNESTNLREQCLIMTNYVDSCVKDILVLEIESKIARDLPRDKILDILEDKEILKPKAVKDIRKFHKIRDVVAHQIKKSEAEKKIIEILETMLVKKAVWDTYPNWNEMKLEEKVFIIQVNLLYIIDSGFQKALI